jgi:hypothetical protein
LQIKGSKYFFNVAGRKKIAIGDYIFTVGEWKNVYKEKFLEYHFTEEEQAEYIGYFNEASKLHGYGFTLSIS